MMKNFYSFTLLICSFFTSGTLLWGQATVSCPSNITVNAASGQCGANVSFSAPTASCAGGGTNTVTFNYTGAVQTWTVPAGVTSINIKCYGGQGRANQANILGGKGGYATGNRTVTPLSTVYVYVGGGGGISTTGGFNGGGNAGTSPCTQALAGGGGGGSDVRIGGTALGNRVIVAGGGGGAGGQRLINCGRGTGGGGGGGYYGGGGGAGWPGVPPGGAVPTGGSQSSGGSGGVTTWTAGGPTNGAAGGLGVGGKGGNEESSAQFGSATAQPGGYGGGTTGQNGLYNSANDWTGQSGAGGSGYIGGVTSGSMLNNQQSGNGLVTITYTVAYTPTVTQTGGSSSGAFFPVGSTTNAFTASCPVGSNSSCSFTVTVVDNQNPTITCPANMTVNAASGQCSAVVTYSVTSADNCPGQTVSKTAGLNSGATFPVGTTSNSYKVTDASGKTATCSFNVTVVDNQNPSITCPSNITLNAASGSCTAVATYSVSSSDNCPGQTVSQGTGLPSGASFPTGTTPNTFVVTDAAGHVASCAFTVTVTDNQNPTITCPGNITVSASNGQCSAPVSFSVSSADNCVGSTQSQSAGLASGANFPVGVTTNSFTVTDAASNTANCSFTVTVVDNQNPAITCPANITVNNATGQCAANVTYSVTSSDNCPGQTVSQSAGLASTASFPVGTTTNTFLVTDAHSNTNNCSFTVTVVDNESPVITCPANISVNASSNNCSPIVTWTSPSPTDNCAITTQTQTHNSGSSFPPGNTTVTYTVGDAAGNSTSCSFTVSVVPTPLVLSLTPTVYACGTNLACNGDNSGSITVTATGGCEPYSYSWSNGGTTATINGLSAIKYVVTVTDNNSIVKKDSITLTQPAAITGSIQAPPGVCGPATTGFTDLTVGGGATCQSYLYDWTGPGSFTANTEDLTNLGSGTFAVIVTDANGCTFEDSVNIALFSLPVANLGADSTICDGSTHILNPGSFSAYLWQNNATSPTLPVSTAGTYWTEVTDANGCQDRDTIEIAVHTVTPTTQTYSETVPLCQADTATITATPGYSSYLWAGPVVIGTVLTNNSVDVTSPGGDIYLTISDTTGCARTDTITVPFVNQPDPNPSILPDPGILCPGGQDTLDAGAGYATYAWSTGATTRTIIVNTAGTYSVEVTNSFGCGEADDVTAINVPAPVPVITQSNDTLFCQTGFAKYQWAINGTPLAFATNYYYIPPVSGQYSVTVIDANGCTGTATFDVTVGISENQDFAGLEVFPNPTEGYLNIRPYTPIGKEVDMTIFDMFGKLVKQYHHQNLTKDETLNLTDLAKGVYVLTITTDNSRFVRKIILE
ncbi:MAG: HYR domain-containing protein [Bacteroidia bacterium]|nr:HYR domain-containing protein [Bacteroidia bacterium]